MRLWYGIPLSAAWGLFGHLLTGNRPHLLEGILEEEFGEVRLTFHPTNVLNSYPTQIESNPR